MSDRNSEKPIICYFRKRKRKFSRESYGDLVELEESEKLEEEEVKKRMLRDSVDEENDGIMKKNTCDVNLTGIIDEEAIVMVDDDDVKPKKNAVAMAIEFNNPPSSSEEVVESERGFQDNRPICMDSDDSEVKIERLLQERSNSNNKDYQNFERNSFDDDGEMFNYMNRRRSYLWKAPGEGKLGGYDPNDFRHRYSEEEKGKGKVVDDDSLSTGMKESSDSDMDPSKSEEDLQNAASALVNFKEVMEDRKALEENQKKELEELDRRERALRSARSDAWRRRRDKGWERERIKEFGLKVAVHNQVEKNEISPKEAFDELRHRLSMLLCDSRRMDSHFLQLLMIGCPTEIRVRDCSGITDEQFAEIFGSCNTKYLRVLQLDLCGRCMPDYTLSKTLARSVNSFPALTSISLRGACRLSDIGLRELSLSAPSLQSINLGQCSLITSAGISTLANNLGSILKELYIDDCPNINALHILPALKKFEQLEVLSVAGIQTVCDAFVTDLITERGPNMKEIMLADCVNLTDISVKAIGNSCRRLCALDLSKLDKLTDSALHYVSNGCSSIQVLRLCGNAFSDEAIAAFLEVSGKSLKELSLNYITKVGPNTALSLAKYSRALLSLDLSWCRKLADEALGLIVDNCRSLRLLKLFGCTQLTDVFQNGHSNSSVRIIGLKHLPLL